MKVNYSDQEVIKEKKSIFLAGPTPRDESKESWRNEACAFLEKNGFDGIVYQPEYSTRKPKADYVDQAAWEREALTAATVILFWVPRELPNMPAFTTNVEFGYWLHSGKVVYGRPNSASKVKYLDWLYNVDTGLEPKESMEELLLEAMRMADELYDEKESVILPLKDRKMLIKK